MKIYYYSSSPHLRVNLMNIHLLNPDNTRILSGRIQLTLFNCTDLTIVSATCLGSNIAINLAFTPVNMGVAMYDGQTNVKCT